MPRGKVLDLAGMPNCNPSLPVLPKTDKWREDLHATKLECYLVSLLSEPIPVPESLQKDRLSMSRNGLLPLLPKSMKPLCMSNDRTSDRPYCDNANFTPILSLVYVYHRPTSVAKIRYRGFLSQSASEASDKFEARIALVN